MMSSAEATEALRAMLLSGSQPLKTGESFATDRSMEGGLCTASTLSNGEVPLLNELFPRPGGKQTIKLTGSDQQNSFSVYAEEVTVVTAAKPISTCANSGSNKVRINSLVNYDWEHKHYIGELVAAHKDGEYVAYVLKGMDGGVVRIFNRNTSHRVLLKNMKGAVVDVSFAHCLPCILGIVDEYGSVYIHELIEQDSGKFNTKLLLQVNRPKLPGPAVPHRLIWCPYIPDEDESSSAADSSLSEDASRVLVVTHGSMAEMFNVDLVVRNIESPPYTDPDDIQTGRLVISNHSKAILDAAFSPDGTALATASEDGYVKFFQVYMNEVPRCLHKWQPHEGLPVNSLCFLDDHKLQFAKPEVQFWKFAVTGADNNRELKIWSCESWQCLQTLNFQCPLNSSPDIRPCLKAALDMSGNYFVLTDITRKVMYVLQMYQPAGKALAYVSSISEFVLAQSCFSFTVIDAKRKKLRRSIEAANQFGDHTTGDVLEEEDDENQRDGGARNVYTVLQLYAMHTKALEHLEIRFQPETSAALPSPSTQTSLSFDSAASIRDYLSDLSLDQVEGRGSKRSSITQLNSNSPILLTPDAFSHTSPKKESRETTVLESPILTAARASNISSISTLTHVTGIDDEASRSVVGLVMNTQTPNSSVTGSPHSSREKENFDGYNKELMGAGDVGRRGTPPQRLLPQGANDADSPASFYTSSPAVTLVVGQQDFQPPIYTRSTMENWDGIHQQSTPDLSHVPTPPAVQRSSLPLVTGASLKRDSEGSCSAASIEVSEILDQVKTEEEKYDTGGYGSDDEDDENDEEGGEGDDEDEDDGRHVDDDKENSSNRDATGLLKPQDDDGVEIEEEEEIEEDIEEIEEDIEEDTTGRRSQEGIWPKVPDVRPSSASTFTIDKRMAVGRFSEQDDDEASLDGKLPPQPSITMVRTHTAMEESEGEQLEEFPPTHTQGSFMAVSFQHELQMLQQQYQKNQTQTADQLQALQGSLHQLLGLVQSQQQEMGRLGHELRGTQEERASIAGLQEQMDNLQAMLASKVTETLSQHSLTEVEKLQQVLGQRESSDQQKHEAMLSTLTQSLERLVTQRFERIIKDETKTSLIPALNKMIEPTTRKLHVELAEKLTSSDHLLRESISKMVKSKPVLEVLATSLADAVHGPVHNACRDLLIPAYEKATHTLFQQINTTFHKGINDYTYNLERHLEQFRYQQEKGRDAGLQQVQRTLDEFRNRGQLNDQATQQIQGLATKLDHQVSQISQQMTQFQRGLQQSMVEMQHAVTADMQRAIREEVASTLQEQQSMLSSKLMDVVRSQAATPAPTTPSALEPSQPSYQQLRQNVEELIKNGLFNQAFQDALSASNLALVLHVCELLDPAEFFSRQPCPLQQPVLLSLIQQLSADLSTKSQLKHKFLEEAVMNLDKDHPITVEHMPTVLAQLQHKLRQYIEQRPGTRMTRNMKMLLMAAQGLA